MRYYLVMLLATSMLCIAGCGDDNDGGGAPAGDTGTSSNEDAAQDDDAETPFPAILDVTVDPDELTLAQAESTEFSVQIVLNDGFEGEIIDADAFIQIDGTDRGSQSDSFEQSGNTLELIGVSEAWFGGLEAGSYQIGAEVVSDRQEDITHLDLATVTLTE